MIKLFFFFFFLVGVGSGGIFNSSNGKALANIFKNPNENFCRCYQLQYLKLFPILAKRVSHYEFATKSCCLLLVARVRFFILAQLVEVV